MPDRTERCRWHRLAAVLAEMPDVIERLLDIHLDAGCGRCRACTRPGYGTPNAPWPCPTRKLADEAARIRARRERLFRAGEGSQ